MLRYEAPNVRALNFVLRGALGGGGPKSLRSDNLGKTLGGALVRLEIDVPDEVATRRRRLRDVTCADQIVDALPTPDRPNSPAVCPEPGHCDRWFQVVGAPSRRVRHGCWLDEECDMGKRNWRRITPEVRREIIRLAATGARYEDIAQAVSRSVGAVGYVVRPLGGVIRAELWQPSAARLSVEDRVEIRLGLERDAVLRDDWSAGGAAPVDDLSGGPREWWSR